MERTAREQRQARGVAAADEAGSDRERGVREQDHPREACAPDECVRGATVSRPRVAVGKVPRTNGPVELQVARHPGMGVLAATVSARAGSDGVSLHRGRARQCWSRHFPCRKVTCTRKT
eukprot:1427141-Prymnesium_polylepis.1